MKLDALEFQLSTIFEASNFIFESFCLNDLLVHTDVGVNH